MYNLWNAGSVFLRLGKHLFNTSKHLCMSVCMFVCMSYDVQSKHCFSLPKQKYPGRERVGWRGGSHKWRLGEFLTSHSICNLSVDPTGCVMAGRLVNFPYPINFVS
jgi:hypothetical protein